MMASAAESLFIFAGEPSGDKLGGTLVKAFREQFPSIHIEGVAGPNMRAEKISGPAAMEDFMVMGLSDVVKSLPRLIRQFHTVRNAILKRKPDAVILVDYPGFNLRMAKSLRQKGYKGKIVQYVSPSVWAWGKHRIDHMAATLDLLLTVYPFEAECYHETNLNVEYVGSPVKEHLGRHQYEKRWKEILGIPNNRPIVAIFPGSREGEIKINLPLIIEAADMFRKDHPEVHFAISCRDDRAKSILEDTWKSFPEIKANATIVPASYSYELMQDSRCAIAKSGTVTLELALHKCPSVVVFKISQLNRWYVQYILKAILPHYCIVNILSKNEVFPELIKSGLSVNAVYNNLKALYEDTPERKACIQSCHDLTLSLGSNRASTCAANAVLGLI